MRHVTYALGILTALADRDCEIFSDELNHACLIDGARLSRAIVTPYPHADIAALDAALRRSKASSGIVATDAVFSMDGDIADVPALLALCERHDAWLVLDDAHGIGVLGPCGRGTLAHLSLASPRILLMATLGKALGGASGGYVSGRRELVAMLRQRSRPYLFSNSVAPPIAAASLKVLELIRSAKDLRQRLRDNTAFFRSRMTEERFDILAGEHPIVPVMIGDAARAARMAEVMLEKGVYVIGFSFPVVPQGKARIRAQVSASHSKDDLERAVRAFVEAREAVA